MFESSKNQCFVFEAWWVTYGRLFDKHICLTYENHNKLISCGNKKMLKMGVVRFDQKVPYL